LLQQQAVAAAISCHRFLPVSTVYKASIGRHLQQSDKRFIMA